MPDDSGLKQNPREIELRRAQALAKAGKCEEARPLARAGDDGDKDGRGRQLLELCANERAGAKAKARDWEGAVVELRRGLRDAPQSKTLDDNLGRMLHNVAVAHLQQKKCDDATALVPELKARKQDEIVGEITKICR